MPAIPPGPEDQPDTSPTWGDYGRAALHGAEGTAASLSAATRYMHEAMGVNDYGLHAAEEQGMGREQERTLGAMSPAAQERLQASITSGEFWRHPFSAGALKSADMTAPLLATVVPAGIASGAIGATIAAGLAGGAIGTGQMLQEFDKRIDDTPDEKLQGESPLYRGLRLRMDEGEARSQFRQDILGAKPALTFLFSAAANAIGPSAQVARALKGTSLVGGESGVLGRAAKEGAVGALGGAMQGGASDVSVQGALMEGGLQSSFDQDKLVTTLLDYAGMGLIMGGAAGAMSRGKGPRSSEARETPVQGVAGEPAKAGKDGEERAAESVGPPLKNYGTGNAPPPSEDVKVGTEVTHTELSPEQKRKEFKKNTVGDKLRKKEAARKAAAGKELPAVQDIAPDHVEALKGQESAPGPDAAKIVADAAAQAKEQAEATRPAPDHMPEQAVPPAIEHLTPGKQEVPPAVEHLTPGAEQTAGITPQVTEQTAKPQFNNSHDVVSGSVASKDPNGPIYIDKHIPEFSSVLKTKTGEPVPLWHLLGVHETAERDAMASGMPYPEAHTKIATPAERAEARKLGVDWRKYSEEMDGYLAKVEREKDINPPPDPHVNPEQAIAGDKLAGPRVLEDQSAESKANIKAQDKQLDKNLKAATAEPTEKVAPSHKSKEVQAAKAARDTTAEEITTKHAPAEGEDSAATLVRAEQMSSAARTAGVTIPKVLRGDVHPSVAILNEAQRLAKKNETRRPPKELEAHVTTFRLREAALREGDIKAAKSDRGVKEYETASTVQVVPETVVLPPNDSGTKIAPVVGSETESTNAALRGFSAGTEKAVVRTKTGEEEVLERGKAFSGDKLTVEAKLKMKREREQELLKTIAALGQKEEESSAKNFFVKPDIDVLYSPRDEGHVELNKGIERELNRNKRMMESLNKRPEPKPELTSPALPRDGESQLVKSLDGERDTVSLASYTAKSLHDHLRAQGATDSPFKSFISRRLLNYVSHIPVHVLDDEQIYHIRPGTKNNIAGFYDSHNKYIAIAADLLNDPNYATRVLMHEAAHAFTYDAIRKDPRIGRIVDMLLERSRGEHRGEEKVPYGLTDRDEFLSEMFSNTKFQEFLARIDLDSSIRSEMEKLFGPPHSKVKNLWSAFVDMLRRAMRLAPHEYTMLEAGLRIGAEIESQHLREETRASSARATHGELSPALPRDAVERLSKALTDHAGETIGALLRHPELQTQRSKPWLLALRTLDQIAQVAENYFPSSVIRTISDTVERMRIGAEKRLDEVAPMIAKIYQLEKKYSADGTWQKFAQFAHAATTAQAHPDVDLAHPKNKHLHAKSKGDEHLDMAWERAQHAELAKQYRLLPQDLKDAYHEATAYYSKTQNDMSLGIINNRILKALGHDDSSLGARIFDKNTTDADILTLGHGDAEKGKATLKVIQEARELAKIEGPYVPLMRRGDFVVSAHLPVEAPQNATRVAENVHDFADRDVALRWAKTQEAPASVQSVWVDKSSGSEFVKDPEDGTERRILKQDVDAEQRFRVTVQNRHVEFHETAKEAQAAAARLEKDVGKDAVQGVMVKRYEKARDAEMTSSQMQTLLRSLSQRAGWDKMTPREKHAVEEALREASIRFMGSTRIQSKRLPRTNVAGYSTELVRNMHEYAVSASSHLARLEHAPVLEDAVKKMNEQASGDFAKDSSLSRSAIARRVEEHLDRPLFDENKGYHSWVKRIMTASFLDKLFGPSQNIINSLQPGMVTMPVLAARHGVGRTFGELRRAYSDIGGLGIVKKGLKDTLAKAKNTSTDTGNLIDDIVARAAKTDGERAMFKHLLEVGSISPEAGLEISQLIKMHKGVGGKLDTGLGYLEGIARQMPRAIEAMNRSATALSAYRLELAKGATHEAATRYAQETVNSTQFLYSATNRPKLFNHPLARLSLQFKQFGQGMYHLLGQNIGRALQGEDPQVRREAIKTLAGIAATHMAFAGVLGLPTEPFKYLMMGAQGMGLTGYGWGDVEDQGRKIAAGLFGKKGGEAVMAGLPRLLGIDLSSRVGLSSLTTFGEPRLGSPNAEDAVNSYLFKSIAGAPYSLLSDWVKGAHSLVAGDFEKAGELMIPIKFIADSMRAYRESTEGKKNAAGKQTFAPYSPYEAGVRSLGFTPSREAEHGAQSGVFYNKQKRQQQERSTLINAWVSAKPTDKASALRAVQSFNKGAASDQQIKMSELSSASKKRATEAKSTVDGIKTDKRSKRLLENSPYVIQ